MGARSSTVPEGGGFPVTTLRADGAKREGDCASTPRCELEPESRTRFVGLATQANLALVYARTGEIDKAIALIERLLSTPGRLMASGPATITLAICDSAGYGTRFGKIRASKNPR